MKEMDAITGVKLRKLLLLVATGSLRLCDPFFIFLLGFCLAPP